MMTIKIDEEKAVTMLVERVSYWTQDSEVIALYEKMYSNYVYGGVFDGGEFDIMAIVDNDYINYTRIMSEGEEGFDELLKVYKEQGAGDCSCETDICDFIEAVDDDEEPKMFLVR